MYTLDIEEKIAGEIAMSENPGRTIRKWREEFMITKQELSRAMGVSSSVVSDYESGRRKSPGSASIRKIVKAFISLDREKGGNVLRRYNSGLDVDAFIDIRDYDHEIPLEKLVRTIGGTNVSGVSLQRHVMGYTIVDGIKAIISLNSSEFSKLYGWSSQRAVLFTQVKFGRSPMIAIRVHPLKPAAVVYVQPGTIDELAVKLSQIENIPLIVTQMDVQTISQILSKLK